MALTAITQVLKVVAEDKASATIKRVGNVVETEFGVKSPAAIKKLENKLGNLFGDVIVGGAVGAVAAVAALTAAFVAFSVSASKAGVESLKIQASLSGVESKALIVANGFEKAADEAEASFGRMLVESRPVQTVLQDLTSTLVNLKQAFGGSGGAAANLLPSLGTLAAAPLGMGVPSALARYALGVGGPSDVAESTLRMKNEDIKKLLDLEKTVAAERIAEAEKIENNLAGISKAAAKTTLDALKKSFADKKAAREKAHAEQLRREEQMAAALYKLQRSYISVDTQLSERARGILDEGGALSEADAAGAAGSLFERDLLLDQDEQRRLQRLNAEINPRLAATREMLDLEQRRADLADEETRRQERLASAFQSASSSVVGFLGVIRDSGASALDIFSSLLSTLGSIVSLFPGGSAIGGVLGGLGTLVGGFNDGGVVGAARGYVVPGPNTGDVHRIAVGGGETIIPAGGTHPSFIQQVAAAALNAGGGGGGGTVVFQQQALVPASTTQVKRSMDDVVIPALSSLGRHNKARVSGSRVRGYVRGRRL